MPESNFADFNVSNISSQNWDRLIISSNNYSLINGILGRIALRKFGANNNYIKQQNYTTSNVTRPPNKYLRAVVVAKLVEQLLPIPEVRGSNTVIGKNL